MSGYVVNVDEFVPMEISELRPGDFVDLANVPELTEEHEVKRAQTTLAEVSSVIRLEVGAFAMWLVKFFNFAMLDFDEDRTVPVSVLPYRGSVTLSYERSALAAERYRRNLQRSERRRVERELVRSGRYQPVVRMFIPSVIGRPLSATAVLCPTCGAIVPVHALEGGYAAVPAHEPMDRCGQAV